MGGPEVPLGSVRGQSAGPIISEDGVSISIAMIMLGPDAELSVRAIRADLAAQWPALPESEGPEEGEGTFSFRIGSIDVIAGLMPGPIPWSDLEGPCATSWLWADAADVLRGHTAHLILTVSGEGGPVDRMKLLTQLTASILATCPGAIGVFWTHAALVIPPAMFRDFATQILPDGLPLYIWVDFRVGGAEAGRSKGFTYGMESLGSMEFETLDSPEPPGELRERFFGLATYVLEHGPVIRDGDTIGEDAVERIRVDYAESSFGQDGRVMRLVYTPVKPKKWRLW